MSNISDKPWLVPGHMYQYDIGWLVDKLLAFETELNTAIDLKTIHYADPIQWDITTQYAPNTVVVDPKTGTAYMSKVPVPAGILLTNTDYWVVIFNYQRIYNKIMAGVAYNEEDNLYASKDFAINDLVWYGGDLYRCIKEIAEGGKFVVDVNITPTTIESLLDSYYGKKRTAHVASDTITAEGDITESAANKNVTVTGGITESAATKNVTVTGDITESAANKNVTATGDITESAANKNVTVTGGITESAANKNITVTGDITESAANKNITVTGGYEVAANDITASAVNSIERCTNKSINADTMSINLSNPLRYSKPTVIDNNFDGIKLADPDGNAYDVLVFKRHIEGGVNTKIGYNGSIMTKTDLPHDYQNAQGGTYFNGYYYQAVRAAETNQIIYKINEITGQYTYKEFTQLYHANGMTNDGTYIYVVAWGASAKSPYKIYKLNTDLDIITSYNIDITLINIAYDKATSKMYGSTGKDIYELVLENNVRYTKLFTLSGYFTDYVRQGLCVHDGTLYYALSAPESILKTDLQGSYYTLIVLDTIVNNLFELGELEDLEWVNGRLYTFSYLPSKMTSVGNSPVLLLFGNVGLNNDTIFDDIDMRRDTIYCGNANSFKCIGSESNPFDDTEQAALAARAMNKVYPIYYKILVNNVDKVYNGFYIQGNFVKGIEPVSGKPKIRYLKSTNAVLYIRNFTIYGKVTNIENVVFEGSIVTLQDIQLSSIDACANRSFIAANGSIVSFISVLPGQEDQLYNLGKVTYAGFTSMFRCYPKTTAYIQNSGTPISLYGVEVARNISVTTTAKLITWNRIMPNDVSLAKYTEFSFIINGRSYGVNKSCKIVIDDITITITFSNGRFTVSANKNITIDSIIAVR